MKLSKEQIYQILKLHRLWVAGHPQGVRANLTGADLSGLDLAGYDFRQAILAGADLSWTYLASANLRETDLSGAKLVGAVLNRSILAGADLRGADLSLSYAYLSDLALVNTTGAKMTEINWRKDILKHEYSFGGRPSNTSASPRKAGRNFGRARSPMR